MSFSAGGTGPMLSIRQGERRVSLSWPAPLPAPVLVGDTATYPEVLPGVDLKLAAGADSFSQVLVVKNQTAAQNPALSRLRFGLGLNGVSIRQDATTGFLQAVDPSGNAVFVSDGARMWDSPSSGATARLSAGSVDEEPQRLEQVPVQLSPGALTVLPSREMLSHPDTNFPLYIDPGFNGGSEIWTHVSRNNPNTSYWTDSSTRTDMRVGQLWHAASDDDWRTFVQFDVGPLKGAKIYGAAVLVVVGHSADCSLSPLQLWRTNAISKSSAVTWNNTKDKTWLSLAEVNASANKRSCPTGDDEVRFSNANVVKSFQDYASAGYSLMPLVFRAKSESDEYQWKKLVPGSTYLDINFDHLPAQPTGIKFAPCNTSACTAPVWSGDSTPTLTMAVTDPNGGVLRYEYEVYDYSRTKLMLRSGTSVTNVQSGRSQPWSLARPLANGEYNWRGRGCDSHLCGKYSSWYNFRLDSTQPNRPSVSSTSYKPAVWAGAPGQAGDFTFGPGTAGDSVKEYVWTLNGGLPSTWLAGAGGTVTKPITPDRDMVNHLTVEALDSARNRSGTIEYNFLVQPISDTWRWALDEAAGVTAASTPVNNQSASVVGTGVRWAESGYQDSPASLWFAGGGQMETPAPVLRTAGAAGFTVAAAVYLGPEPALEPEGVIPPPTVPGPGEDPDVEQTPDNTPAPAVAEVPLPSVNQTAVTQDGINGSMFRLGYRADLDLTGDGKADPAWCFTVLAGDVATAGKISACSTQFVNTTGWVHLTGVADPAANGGQGQIRLYVNGTPAQNGAEAIVAGKALWASNGKLAIGRGWKNDTVDRFTGGIDDVYAVPRVWTSTEINQRGANL